MDAWFWLVQIGWLAFLACGAYLSFCFWKLSDEEGARTAELQRHASQDAKPSGGLPSFILCVLD